MNKKVKLKGRLNMYMRWPVLLSALLLVATVLMYLCLLYTSDAADE